MNTFRCLGMFVVCASAHSSLNTFLCFLVCSSMYSGRGVICVVVIKEEHRRVAKEKKKEGGEDAMLSEESQTFSSAIVYTKQ